MATLYTHRDANIRKTWLFMGFIFVLVIIMGWLFGYVLGSPIIFYIAILLALLLNIGGYWYSDKLVLSLTRARPIEKQDNPELYRIVENLAITAGLPMPRIYLLNEIAPNAFATGRDAKHAVVAVTRGLLERLDRTELEGVLAHELSHIGNRDILISSIAVVLVGFIVILSDMFLRITFYGGLRGRRGGSRQGGQLQLILLVLALIAAILAPLVATLLRLAVSRKREFLADASGTLLTRFPDGLAQALEKIAQDPNELSVASNATAHLFFENPFKGRGGVSWFTKLFMTHPPVEERIAALRNLKT